MIFVVVVVVVVRFVVIAAAAAAVVIVVTIDVGLHRLPTLVVIATTMVVDMNG